jgi:hypothetical protein
MNYLIANNCLLTAGAARSSRENGFGSMAFMDAAPSELD